MARKDTHLSRPPYFEKGRCLYLDSYCASDHADIASLMQNTAWKQKWIVSYDDVPEINSLYAKSKKISYALSYSARKSEKDEK